MTATVLQCDREALKPCPFCGGEASFEHLESGRWSVGCNDADGQCMGFQTLQTFARQIDAATAWNTRHDSTREMGFDDWCKRQIAKLSAIMNPYVMQGLDLDAPDYRHLLGQHHAFMRMRSFIHGSRKQGTDR